ncbi:MAG: 2'-5' RNA ligase family protein [Aureispira sp.]|nr:2'-5' RNA ligase family protein [Aureispira sp.]
MKKNQALYFIAICPPEPILSEIKALKMDLYRRYHTRTALRSPAHITLYMPFRWNEKEEQKLSKHLEDFFSQYQSFEIVLNGFDCFRPKVLFIKPEENLFLSKIHKDLVFHLQEELAINSYSKEKRAYNPHMTLANRDLQANAFEEAWKSLSKQTYHNIFMADKGSLLKYNSRTWEPAYNYELLK